MQLWQFALAVKSHYELILLCLLFVVAHAAQHFLGERWTVLKAPPTWALRMGAFISLVFACFLAWSDERTAKESAQAELKTLRENKTVTTPSGVGYASTWGGLTEIQIDHWATKLAPLHIKSMRVNWGNNTDGLPLLHSMRKIGKIIGCEVALGTGSTEGKIIYINANKTDPVGPILLRLFIAADYPAELLPSDQPDPQIDIIIGEKP